MSNILPLDPQSFSKIIKVSIKNEIATLVDITDHIVCNNSKYGILFEFDDAWNDAKYKTARFIYNDIVKDDVFTGNLCAIPPIAHSNILKVGVFAGDLTTSTSAVIPCKKSILCEEGDPTPPGDEDIYEKILSIAESAEKKVDDAKSTFDTAIQTAQESASDAAVSAEAAKESTQTSESVLSESQRIQSNILDIKASIDTLAAGVIQNTNISNSYASSADSSAKSAISAALSAERSAQVALQSADKVGGLADDLNNLASVIKEKVSGEIVGLTDVSPIEHEIDVKVRSKNIYSHGSTLEIIKNTSMPVEVSEGKTYTASAILTAEEGFTGRIRWKYSLDGADAYTNDNVFIKSGISSSTVTVPIGATNVSVLFQVGGSTHSITWVNIQVEEGSTATDYIPYVDVSTVEIKKYGEDTSDIITYTPNEDGTVEGVTSLYPTTTLMTDTAGAVIDATYNADTKKYIDKKFAELQALLLEV